MKPNRLIFKQVENKLPLHVEGKENDILDHLSAKLPPERQEHLDRAIAEMRGECKKCQENLIELDHEKLKTLSQKLLETTSSESAKKLISQHLEKIDPEEAEKIKKVQELADAAVLAKRGEIGTAFSELLKFIYKNPTEKVVAEYAKLITYDFTDYLESSLGSSIFNSVNPNRNSGFAKKEWKENDSPFKKFVERKLLESLDLRKTPEITPEHLQKIENAVKNFFKPLKNVSLHWKNWKNTEKIVAEKYFKNEYRKPKTISNFAKNISSFLEGISLSADVPLEKYDLSLLHLTGGEQKDANYDWHELRENFNYVSTSREIKYSAYEIRESGIKIFQDKNDEDLNIFLRQQIWNAENLANCVYNTQDIDLSRSKPKQPEKFIFDKSVSLKTQKALENNMEEYFKSLGIKLFGRILSKGLKNPKVIKRTEVGKKMLEVGFVDLGPGKIEKMEVTKLPNGKLFFKVTRGPWGEMYHRLYLYTLKPKPLSLRLWFRDPPIELTIYFTVNPKTGNIFSISSAAL